MFQYGKEGWNTVRDMFAHEIWWVTMRLPLLIREFIQICLFIPKHKRILHNTKVYDGLTKNDFIKGELIEFLGKVGAIKAYTIDECPDDRWYFGVYIDEEN